MLVLINTVPTQQQSSRAADNMEQTTETDNRTDNRQHEYNNKLEENHKRSNDTYIVHEYNKYIVNNYYMMN